MGEQHRGRVTVGMQAKTSDGEKLGKVVSCQPNGIVVEKGFLFPKDISGPLRADHRHRRRGDRPR